MHKSVIKLSLFILLLTILACQNRSEGCLDLEATNFDAAADENCCCNYPILELNYRYHYDSLTNFTLDKNYPLDNGDSVQFRKFAMYISDVGLWQENNFIIGQDSIVLYRRMFPIFDSVVHVRNVNIIRRSPSSSRAGLFPASGHFSQLSFRFGLDFMLNQVSVEDYPLGYVLGYQADSLHTLDPAEGYIFLKLQLYFPETDTLRTFNIKGADKSYVINKDIDFNSQRGKDRRIFLGLDFKQLIQGIDFETDPEDSILEKIRLNIDDFFQVE